MGKQIKCDAQQLVDGAIWFQSNFFRSSLYSEISFWISKSFIHAILEDVRLNPVDNPIKFITLFFYYLQTLLKTLYLIESIGNYLPIILQTGKYPDTLRIHCFVRHYRVLFSSKQSS